MNVALEKRQKPTLKREVSFIIVHLLPLGALGTGATTFDLILCVSLYFIRMFFVTGVYHRYFSHKTYKTSRWFQFFLAFMAQTTAQKGVLWWAANHRIHHMYSDTPKDPHSMYLYGFWYSHLGWIMGPDYKQTRFDLIKDYAKYPELVWLNKNYLVPPMVMAFLVTILGGYVNGGSLATMFTHGWSTLFIGFFLSTVILYHGTFSINSLMHKIGRVRYKSNDKSKNSFWLALITMGEGWHNNHHYYQATARQGFYWWEIDVTFYIIKVLSWLGLIWDVKGLPDHVKKARSHEEAQELAKAKREEEKKAGKLEKEKAA